MTLNENYFDEYSYEQIRNKCLEQIETYYFKYPNRCRKIFYKGNYEWREYMGAGKTCSPELKK